jgi:putative flavoprotein involved in K+ transport
MSGLLREREQEHLVVERRDRLGGSWQDRWDTFSLVTPNWVASFPGMPYDGPDRDGFMGRDAITERVARYADVVAAPVALGTTVERLVPTDNGSFQAVTNRGNMAARRVVVATGAYHTPRIPPLAHAIAPRVTQLHAHDYRNVAGLPPGGILVAGSGQTGIQLAQEFHDAGRPTWLAVGTAGRVPRRYRGLDIFDWLVRIEEHGAEFGLHFPTAETLPDPNMRFAANPTVLGSRDGREVNLRRFAADGIGLGGRLIAADGERLTFAPDLEAGLRFADRFFDENVREVLDTFAERAGLDLPPDDRQPFEFEPVPVTELHLADAGISTIVWATGYGLDYSWIDAPILGEHGYPRNVRGVTEIPGLFFLGLLWQHSEGSATLVGPMLDAPHLLEQMALVPA